MITAKVTKNFEVDSPGGSLILKQGQTIKLSYKEAFPLIKNEFITPLDRLIYRIYSEILGCHLWVIETEQDLHYVKNQGHDEAAYTIDEIKKLKSLDRDSLKHIHQVKEIFPGSKIIEVTRKDVNENEVKEEKD
ncbi:MAG: hypothetical protein A2Y81_11845 [Nitrospirae bacterium RBG_13_43_8]|nr:MAG: hypothetical protein A2Y81_11845 [Nitrospirae bacterium RBG_13_43_8]